MGSIWPPPVQKCSEPAAAAVAGPEAAGPAAAAVALRAMATDATAVGDGPRSTAAADADSAAAAASHQLGRGTTMGQSRKT